MRAAAVVALSVRLVPAIALDGQARDHRRLVDQPTVTVDGPVGQLATAGGEARAQHAAFLTVGRCREVGVWRLRGRPLVLAPADCASTPYALTLSRVGLVGVWFARSATRSLRARAGAARSCGRS